MSSRASRSSLPTRTAILVVAFDSQLKWAGTIQSALESLGFACRTIIPSDIRHAISDGQRADNGGGPVGYMSWADLVIASLSADVVVLAIQMPQVRRFCHELFDLVELTGVAPPVTITGGVGVFIEKIVGGCLERYASVVAFAFTTSPVAL